MSSRNVQKTGKMHYVYLPTSWCKENKIKAGSQVFVEPKNDGTLSIATAENSKELKSLNLSTEDVSEEIITKIIMACYINPIKHFNIKLDKKKDIVKLLKGEKYISGFEFVEFDENNIIYESSMSVYDPDALLKTMVKKIKNLVNLMITGYDSELIKRYEEEIDKSKILIIKAVVSALSSYTRPKMSVMDIYYTSQIAQYLEKMVDSLIQLDKNESNLLKQVLSVINDVKGFVEDISLLDYKRAIVLARKVSSIKSPTIGNIKSYGKRRIRSNLINISDMFLDWAIMKEIDK